MTLLLLRFDAPLMSFGAPIVDSKGVIQPYPALSMLAGLLGNALGYHHADADALDTLQNRLRYAVREDRRGRQLRDFQTVDISQPHMRAYGRESRAWTTRGTLENRTNQNKKGDRGPLIRERDYWADAAYTVALTLDPPEDTPTVHDVADALAEPARPLFLGRKPCLPAEPLFVGTADASTLLEALADPDCAPLARRSDPGPKHRIWWPADDARPAADVTEDHRSPVTDRRDWTNQIHVGRRWVAQGHLAIADAASPNT